MAKARNAVARYLPEPPSPNDHEGCPHRQVPGGTQMAGREVSAITASMARRRAPARPMGFLAIWLFAVVTSLTVAALNPYGQKIGTAEEPVLDRAIELAGAQSWGDG
jgi:hypothetical protein